MVDPTGFPVSAEVRARPAGRRLRRLKPGRVAGDRAPGAASPARRTKARLALSATVMALAAGIVATLALPSYAFDPTQEQPANGATRSETGQQQFTAAGDLDTADLSRDSFRATSSAALIRAAYKQKFAAYDGPSADDYLKNPAHPPFSLDAVFDTALQYQGVPYVFGGADPSGFDCSGFIMFVYAQYGVALPHSVHSQDGIGTPIAEADAQPGDVVIFNDDSHDGFYAGDGMILHAPYPGARVRIQPIWTANVHFVRFGI